MTSHADLELTLRGGAERVVADLRFRAPASRADADLALGIPLAFDGAALPSLALDPAAYGRALSAQLFAEPRMREAWATVRGFLQGSGAVLRLRLRIDPRAEGLHGFCWETLHT